MHCYYLNFQPTRSFARIISTIRSRYSANLNRFYAADLIGPSANTGNIKLAMKRFDNWVLKSSDNCTLCVLPTMRILLQIFMVPRICCADDIIWCARFRAGFVALGSANRSLHCKSCLDGIELYDFIYFDT